MHMYVALNMVIRLKLAVEASKAYIVEWRNRAYYYTAILLYYPAIVETTNHSWPVLWDYLAVATHRRPFRTLRFVWLVKNSSLFFFS